MKSKKANSPPKAFRNSRHENAKGRLRVGKPRAFLGRKGITPIISVILLLMMTIAIAGLAYTWLQGLQGSIQTTTTDTSSRLLGGVNVNLRIDGATLEECGGDTGNTTIYFRNSGTEKANNLQLFVDDVFVTGGNRSTLNAGASANLSGRSWVSTGNVSYLQAKAWNNTRRTFKIVSDESNAQLEMKLICQ